MRSSPVEKASSQFSPSWTGVDAPMQVGACEKGFLAGRGVGAKAIDLGGVVAFAFFGARRGREEFGVDLRDLDFGKGAWGPVAGVKHRVMACGGVERASEFFQVVDGMDTVELFQPLEESRGGRVEIKIDSGLEVLESFFGGLALGLTAWKLGTTSHDVAMGPGFQLHRELIGERFFLDLVVFSQHKPPDFIECC